MSRFGQTSCKCKGVCAFLTQEFFIVVGGCIKERRMKQMKLLNFQHETYDYSWFSRLYIYVRWWLLKYIYSIYKNRHLAPSKHISSCVYIIYKKRIKRDEGWVDWLVGWLVGWLVVLMMPSQYTGQWTSVSLYTLQSVWGRPMFWGGARRGLNCAIWKSRG